MINMERYNHKLESSYLSPPHVVCVATQVAVLHARYICLNRSLNLGEEGQGFSLPHRYDTYLPLLTIQYAPRSTVTMTCDNDQQMSVEVLPLAVEIQVQR